MVGVSGRIRHHPTRAAKTELGHFEEIVGDKLR
jgi:hypothetical protein